MKFDVYTFLSPIIHNIQEEPIIEETLNSEMINYYYILAIVLCIVFLFDVKPRMFKLFQDLITKKEVQSHYSHTNSFYTWCQSLLDTCKF